MLRIALCDDEESQRSEIHALLDQYIASHGICARVFCFPGATALLSAIQNEEAFDLYLLDILMPDMDGIKLGLALRKYDPDGLILYLTTSRDFAVESYEVHAFYYLVKPLFAHTLYPVLDNALSALQNRHTDVIQVKTKTGTVHLPLDDIHYAELKRRVIRYVCKSGAIESLYIRTPFSEAVAPLLKHSHFFLCGSSFAVNLYHITMTDRTGIVLSSGERLELPKTACTALRAAWSDYWICSCNHAATRSFTFS